MRTDSSQFALSNAVRVKRPRYVVEISFDPANVNLWYFTSHTDAALPPGGSSFNAVVEGITGTSQTLSPDKATASIGNISFKIVDRASTITNQLGSQLALGRSTRRQRVRLYVGYEGMVWADYVLVQTQLVANIDWNEGVYTFSCTDIQREMRKEIFEQAITQLSSNVLIGDGTINVVSTAAFGMVDHGASFSDAPSATAGYIKIQDEVIRYSGQTSTSFTGCTRGALNTRPADHSVDLTASQDQRTKVTEYVYLEMPALKAAFALLTGRLHGQSYVNFPGTVGNHARTTDSTPLDVSLDIVITLKLSVVDWTPSVTNTIIAKGSWGSGNNAAYAINLNPSGVLRFFICTTPGTNPSVDSTVATGFADGSTHWIRITRIKVSGVVTFETSLDGINWTTLGSTVVLSANSAINNSPYDLFIGNYLDVAPSTMGTQPLNGKVYFAEIRSGADRTVVSRFDPANFDGSVTTATMDTGEVWTLVGTAAAVHSALPTKWHLGIPQAYVRLADFTNKVDLYDYRDDSLGFITRFEALEKTDGKKFIEQELALLCGSFMPVYANGQLGWKRMSNILAGAGYVRELNTSNVVSAGKLLHDFDSLHNLLQVKWNYEPLNTDFTRITLLVDSNSITVHGKSDPLNLEFRGLHGSRHSSVMLATRFDALRDRYSGPPLRMTVQALPSMNGLETGDVVRVRLPVVRDFVANATLDRSFEIQNVKIDWVTGNTSFDLFASSQAPGVLAPTNDATVLTNAWYTSQGTDLSTVLTITGSNPGHVSANGAITGSSDMTAAPAIYYYNGDLQVDSGKTITITGNVQLRIKGFFQNNGTINGKGGGIAGAAAVGSVNGGPAELFHFNLGTQGFLGTTEAGGGGQIIPGGSGLGQLMRALSSTRGAVITGLNSVVPSFNLSWNGSVLAGVPTDLRGTSGSSGMPAWFDATTFNSGGGIPQPGGAGGAGGAGLMVVSRGFAQGASAKIDLSGGDGTIGTSASINSNGSQKVQSGSGAGGAPGGLFVVLDGAGVSATGLSDAGFVALNGKTPLAPGIAPQTPWSAVGAFTIDGAIVPIVSSMFVGTGDGTSFALPNLSGARGGSRVQYVPNNSTNVSADPSVANLTPPSSLSLASGTNELLLASDGTVIVRIKATWTPSTDARVAGYDIQFKKSADTIWMSAPSVVGIGSNTAWCSGVQDGVNYDVRVRSGDNLRGVSDWLTITNFFVTGKTAKPTDVGSLTFTDPYLTWSAITDPDRRGYIVRYQPGTSTVWATALQAHKEGFITPTKFDTSFLVGGQTTLLVKSLDTSGNEATNVASITVDLRPAEPNTFLISRQPDGTRQFEWTLTTPPDDLAGYRIRYFLGSTSDWTAMTPLHVGLLLSSPYETNLLAAGTYTFAIKSVDKAGNESTNAKFITSVTIGDPRIASSIGDFKEEPFWTGTKTNCSVDTATGWLIANDNGTTWTGLPGTWAGWTQWVNNPFGTITYVRQIDVGVKTKFTPLVSVTGDGTQTIEEQHSDDNISYSSYAAVGPQVDCRYIRIRLTLVDSFPKAKTMRTILSAQPVEEFIQDQNTASLAGAYRIGTGDIRLPKVKSYSLIKNVNVTLQSVGAGWSWELIDKDTTVGPRVKIYNSSNTLADAVIDAEISGV